MIKIFYITAVVFAIFMLYEQKRFNDIMENMFVIEKQKNDSAHHSFVRILNDQLGWIVRTYPDLQAEIDMDSLIATKQMGE